MKKEEQVTGKKEKKPTDWEKEILGSMCLAGKGIFKVFSYLFNIILTILLICIVTGAIVGCAFSIYIKNYVDPTIDESLLATGGTSQTTQIYYYEYENAEARYNRTGTKVELEDQRLYGEQNSLWADYSKIPQDLKDAFVAIEDKRFWDHAGVDWIRTGSAVMKFFVGNSSYGGSSITQQLVKNVTQYDDVTIQRKVQEIVCALNLEKTKSKEEILELYLNIIPLSQRCYGVQSAANTYFGKDVSELSLIECVCIASITNAPTRYDPVQNPESNQERRDIILQEMLAQGYITQEEFDSAYDKEIELNLTEVSTAITTNSWYTDTVIEDVISDLMEKYNYTRQVASQKIYSGGLQIHTLMDPEVQKVMEEVYIDDSIFEKALKKEVSGVPAESSMVVCDPATGDLLGIVGGRGEKTESRILNLAAQAVRPSGSSIKPIAVYAPAMEEGLITWGTVQDDSPVLWFGEDDDLEPWPKNYTLTYAGLSTVNNSIIHSDNTVSVRTLQLLGERKSYEYLTEKMGFYSLIESKTLDDGKTLTDIGLASLALGQQNYGITVREITSAYCTFPNNGVYNKTRSYLYVSNTDGDMILSNDAESNVVFSEETSYIMTKMLENVFNSTASAAYRVTLRKKVDCAGKTGTAGDDLDRWLLGYTPYYVAGVWYGYKIPKVLTNELITSPCVYVWDEVMTRLHQKYIDAAEAGTEELKHFDDTRPSNIVELEYCKDSGKLLTDACALDPRGSRNDKGYFKEGTEPTEYCDCHVVVAYDTQNKGIAHAGSNPDHVKNVSLISISTRDFPEQVTITDAQYVYRTLPSGVRPTDNPNQPYFINSIPEGHYVGRSSDSRQYNTFSSKGFDYLAYEQGMFELVIGSKEIVFIKKEEEPLPNPDDNPTTLPGDDTGEPPETTASEIATPEPTGEAPVTEQPNFE